MTPRGPNHRFANGLRRHWMWLVAAAVLAGFTLPLIAAAYISTGPMSNKSWYWQNPVPQGNPLYAESFVDSANGWAVGGGGVILHTSDAGLVWEAQDPPTQRNLRGIDMVNLTSGWVVGDTGYILGTANGGSSWTTQTAPVATILRAVSAVSTSTAWIVGDGGVILKTVNAGGTWTQQTSGSAAILYGVSAVDTSTAYACGAGGVILKTADGGINWTTLTSGTATQLNAVVAVSATQVWVVGSGGLVRVSADGGTSWNAQTSNSTQNLSAITAASATSLWAAGAAGNIIGTTDAGTTWTLQSNTGSALSAISAGSTSTAYASGASGYMVATGNGGATWESEFTRTTLQLNGVYFSSDATGWAVGNSGTVMRTTDGGDSWTVQQSGTAILYAVHFPDSNTGWAVGAAGRIIKTTDGGLTWVAQTSGTANALYGVWFASTTSGVAVGAGGTILRTANGGATWAPVTSGTASALYGVQFSGSSIGWVVGNGGALRKSTDGGVTWGAQTSGTTQRLLSISCVDTQTVFVSGRTGTVRKTTNGGTAWAGLTSGTTRYINSISMVSATTGWYVAQTGLIFKTTDGSTWTAQTSGTSGNLLGVWARNSTTAWTVGAAGVTRRTTDGVNWTSAVYGTQSALYAISMEDTLTGWAVGAAGTAVHTTDGGDSWIVQSPGTASILYGVSTITTQSVVAAGAAGTVVTSANGGSTWTTRTAGTTNQLNAVAFPTTTGWAVGNAGTIITSADSGATWATQTSGVTNNLVGVYFRSNSLGWAVGAAGRILKTTDGGTTWVPQTSGTTQQLNSVYFSSDTTGYAVGAAGTVRVTANGGTTWSTVASGIGSNALYTITSVNATNVVLAGAAGTVRRSNNGGINWTTQLPGTSNDLRSLSVLGTSQEWMCGTNGTILKITDQTVPSTSISVDPSAPDGNNGWYVGTPVISLVPSKPGITYYNWTSATGPFSTYSTPIFGLEGNRTLYYYSVDTASIAESVSAAPIKTDFTPPTASNLVTVTAVTTSTANVAWSAGTDAISGVSRYDVYVDDLWAASTATTSAALTGLNPNTVYKFTVVTVDTAGNQSPASLPAYAATDPIDTSPLTTVLNVNPVAPNGSNGWYVTTPTVTMSALPNTDAAVILYSWESTIGPYTSYTTTATPPASTSTLYYSAHDVTAVRADEPTQQAPYFADTVTPAAPSVTASVTGYSDVRLTWPAVLDTPSGIAPYDVYLNGAYLISTASPFVDVVGLSQLTTYNFVVYAKNVAGTLSAGSTPESATTPAAPLPSPPAIVYAKSPSGNYAYVNWSAVSTGTVGAVNYRVWRSENGTSFSAIATTTGGVDDITLIDSTLRASTRYWFAVSTIDSRGESPLSSTAASDWPSISTTTTGPQRLAGLTAIESSAAVVLSWQASPNLGTVGYQVMRADASLATPTILTSVPTTLTDTTYFDLNVVNGQPYYYSVAAVDASGVVGSSSLELAARPHGLNEDPTPHITGNDASACICHASHTSTSPNLPDGRNKLVRFPGTTVQTMCETCHQPASALEEFLDPLAKSRHNLEATASVSAPFTCLTCHRPVTGLNEPQANLMRVNGTWVCEKVTNTPPGDGFCYSCHGVGSMLPEGDLSGFESSAHATVTAPPTGAGIKCDACHESHSSRNESLLRYSGYMVCMKCHTSAASDPDAPDLWSRLTLNSDANAKHPLLPQDQTNGAAMTCQNCHNTHSVTSTYPLVDPRDPKPGTWPSSDEIAYCFRCHDDEALPTSAETTPWAGAVLASGAATSVTDIKLAYDSNVHGFGAESGSTTTTAYLRPDMGYNYDAVLECGACHDPHGTVNNYALRQNVTSADGSKIIRGVVVAKVPDGGYDLRFFCSTCHVFDPVTHDVASMANTSTASFPTDCTAAGCHRHMNAAGTQGSHGL